MSSPVFSPPSTPSTPPALPKLQAHCICTPHEIISQLLSEDSRVRFQCLAYYRYGRSSIQHRCEGSFKEQSRPQVFERAKQILERKAPVTVSDYVEIVVRILFCKTHSEANTFKKYRDLFQQYWKGNGSPEELKLMDALRQAHQLPIVQSVCEPDIIISFSSLSINQSNPDPEADSPALNVRSNTPLVSSDTGRVEDVREGQDHHVPCIGPSLARRKYLLPVRPSSRTRTRSNQRNKSNSLTRRRIHAAHRTTEDNQVLHVPSKSWDFPSDGLFNFKYPVIDTPLTQRPLRNETPNQDPSLPTLTSSGHMLDIPLICKSLPSEQVSDKSHEITSSSSVPDNSKLTAQIRKSFVQADWNSHNFAESFNPLAVRNPFKPVLMLKLSKDDTFLEQLSSSADNAAPTLYETTPQHNLPEPEPGNKPSENFKTFEPVVIDTWIRKAIMKPVTKEGYVYILRAPKYFEENYPGDMPRVKIGIAVDVNRRISDLKNDCDLFDLERVEDPEDIPHHLYYKVEEIVHSELANFKREFKCGKCRNRKGGESAHREWFAVPETVALQVVQKWRRFIRTDPYDENGIISDNWSRMSKHNNIYWSTSDEKFDDHEKRYSRWNHWIEEGIKATKLLKEF